MLHRYRGGQRISHTRVRRCRTVVWASRSEHTYVPSVPDVTRFFPCEQPPQRGVSVAARTSTLPEPNSELRNGTLKSSAAGRGCCTSCERKYFRALTASDYSTRT